MLVRIDPGASTYAYRLNECTRVGWVSDEIIRPSGDKFVLENSTVIAGRKLVQIPGTRVPIMHTYEIAIDQSPQR